METPKNPGNSSSSENMVSETSYEKILQQEDKELIKKIRLLLKRDEELSKKIAVVEKMQDLDIDNIESPKKHLDEYIDKVQSGSPQIANQSVDKAVEATEPASSFADEIIKKVKEKTREEIDIHFEESEFLSGITPESFQEIMNEKIAIYYTLLDEVRQNIDEISAELEEREDQLKQFMKSREDILDFEGLLDIEDREN